MAIINIENSETYDPTPLTDWVQEFYATKIDAQDVSEKDQSGGYAGLDGGGKISSGALPNEIEARLVPIRDTNAVIDSYIGETGEIATTPDTLRVLDGAAAGGKVYRPYRIDPYITGLSALTGTWTPAIANGPFQRGGLSGSLTINKPSDGVEGDKLELRLTANSADRALTLHSDIKIPSDSAITFPKTLTSGLSYTILLKRGQTNWRLASFVGGEVD